jgi:hypothetical protein
VHDVLAGRGPTATWAFERATTQEFGLATVFFFFDDFNGSSPNHYTTKRLGISDCSKEKAFSSAQEFVLGRVKDSH